jgi:hypothetical protein
MLSGAKIHPEHAPAYPCFRPFFDIDMSEEDEKILLILEEYFLELWQWMGNTFDNNYNRELVCSSYPMVADLQVVLPEAVAAADIGIPGLGDSSVYLPHAKRGLFDPMTATYEIVRAYPVQGPAYIPLRRKTKLLMGLNWPFDVYVWNGKWDKKSLE